MSPRPDEGVRTDPEVPSFRQPTFLPLCPHRHLLGSRVMTAGVPLCLLCEPAPPDSPPRLAPTAFSGRVGLFLLLRPLLELSSGGRTSSTYLAPGPTRVPAPVNSPDPAAMAPGNFEFIITDQENRSIDGKAREKIRKRAMSATAAARKGSGTWGKQNRRQVPVFVDASDEPAASSTAPAPAAVHVKSEPTSDDARTTTAPPSSSSSSSSSASSSSSSTPVSAPDSQVVARRRQLVRPPRPMPDMGLETVTSRTGMNILDLSALTIVQVGRTASAILGMPTKELSSLISRRRRSYLSFVPSRYGHSPFLDEAIRCLAIRSRRVLVPSARPPETFEMMQYGRALQSLQAAVNGEGWTSPDVLCAVEILSMFEVGDQNPAAPRCRNLTDGVAASRIAAFRGLGKAHSRRRASHPDEGAYAVPVGLRNGPLAISPGPDGE